jgi:hypothetical protein
MLAIANRITGPDGAARVSTTELVRFSNAARSSVITAIDALVKSGELNLLEEGRGTRAGALQDPGSRRLHPPRLWSLEVRSSGPLGESEGSEGRTSSAAQGSENETSTENPRGPVTGPQGSENRTPRGPVTGPHNQNQINQVEEASSTGTGRREITADEKLEFGRFWHNHPKSKNYDRTLDAWTHAVLDGADPLKISASALAYAREVVGQEYRFVKQSDNWIRDRRYEDKFQPEPGANGRPQLRAVAGWAGQHRNPEDPSDYHQDW